MTDTPTPPAPPPTGPTLALLTFADAVKLTERVADHFDRPDARALVVELVDALDAEGYVIVKRVEP